MIVRAWRSRNRRSSGWLIVDLSTGIAGGYCTKILADGGAKVVKVGAARG